MKREEYPSIWWGGDPTYILLKWKASSPFLNLTIRIQIDSPPSQENNTKKTAVNIYYNLSPNSVDPLILELASIIQEANKGLELSTWQ